MKLGYSLPEIIKAFKELQSDKKNNAITKHDVPLGGGKLIEVYEVPIDLPRYRLSNTRTIAMQQKHIADNDLSEEYFEEDPLSDELQEIQHNILLKLIDKKNLKEYFETNKQTDPLIVTNDGFVISGNRRLCTFRELYYSEGGQSKYKHFERIRILILPKCTEEEIEYIEDHYEQQQEIKDDFTWYNRAIGFKKRMERHKYRSTKILADRSGLKESEIKKLLQSLTIADSYLKEIGRDKDYEFVESDQLALESLLKSRKKLDSNASKKSLFQKLCFIALKNQEKMDGRMYANIPFIQETLSDIEEEISNEFEEEINEVKKNKTSINPLNDPTLFPDSSEDVFSFLENNLADNEEAIFEIISEKVSDYKFFKQDKNRKQAVLKNISKAYKSLIEANNIRGHESDKTGILARIENIEKILEELKVWAKK